MAVVAVFGISNLVVTGLHVAFVRHQSFREVLRGSMGPTIVGAYVLLGLSAAVMANLLDGTLLGYILASIICLLNVPALLEGVAGRRSRMFLQRQMVDADIHVRYGRALEGIVHNLSNRLALMKAHLDEMGRHELPPPVRSHLAIVLHAVGDCSTVASVLSDQSDQAGGQIWTAVRMDRVVAECIDLFGPTTRKRRAIVERVGSLEPQSVMGDPLLLREVFTNLLQNALQAVPPSGGEIRVEVTRVDSTVLVRVRDNGPGVPPEEVAHLFTPHRSSRKGKGGVGLGLFTSQSIAREHGGDLRYEASAQGACFVVTLPAAS